MPADINKEANRIYLRLSGELSAEQHHQWISELINLTDKEKGWFLLVAMVDFEGFSVETIRDGLDLGESDLEVFERVAMLGDVRDEPWMASVAELFKSAEVQFFGPTETAEAECWLNRSESGDHRG